MQKPIPPITLLALLQRWLHIRMRLLKTGWIIVLWVAAIPCYAQNTDSLLIALQKAKEDTHKVNLLRNIGVAYSNEDPRKAIFYWKQGVDLSYRLNYIKGLARNYINIGTGYSYLAIIDSTIIYADSGIKYSKLIGDPERLALVYLNKGDAYRNTGDFESALVYCDTASEYAAQTTNTDRQARIYSIISSIYMEQKEFGKALEIGNKALALFKKDNNRVMEADMYDDFAYLYIQIQKIDSALYFENKAVSLGEEIKNYRNLSTYYFGLAQIYLELKAYKDARNFAAKAIAFGNNQENYDQLAGAYKLLGGIYLKEGKLAEALKAGKTAYEYAEKENARPAQQQDVAELLTQVYEAMGDDKNAYRFLKISSGLRDSITKDNYNERVAKLQSSFQIKEKDKEILLLGKDKELQAQKLSRQRILMISSAALALLAFGGIWLLINRNKLKQRMKELELRNQIAADLHDEVGSSLSSIHLLSQMAAQPGNEAGVKHILDKMSVNARETMEKMSDLVWTIKPEEAEGSNLKQRMERFAYEICGAKNIEVAMELSKLDTKDLTMEQRKNMYLIFKEALNNAVKYSGTEKVFISASNGQKMLTMIVKDEGIGFDMDKVVKGNGLDNISSRATSVGGTITVASAPGNGTTVKLVMPLTL